MIVEAGVYLRHRVTGNRGQFIFAERCETAIAAGSGTHEITGMGAQLLVAEQGGTGVFRGLPQHGDHGDSMVAVNDGVPEPCLNSACSPLRNRPNHDLGFC